MFEITQFTNLDITIFIAMIGGIFLYFGEIIGSTQVEKYDKSGYYIDGLFFSLFCIFIPFILAYNIYIKNLLNLPPWVFLVVQLVVFSCLTWTLIAYESKRYDLLDEVKKKAEQRLIQVKEQNSFKGNLLKNWEDRFKSKHGHGYIEYGFFHFYESPIKLFGNKITLLIFSFLTLLSNLWLYKLEGLSFLTSMVFTFLILTLIALAYGFGNAYYPPGKIYMVDGSIIEGKILKFGEYVHVLKDDKKIFINQDKINFVEESKFKIKK